MLYILINLIYTYQFWISENSNYHFQWYCNLRNNGRDNRNWQTFIFESVQNNKFYFCTEKKNQMLKLWILNFHPESIIFFQVEMLYHKSIIVCRCLLNVISVYAIKNVNCLFGHKNITDKMLHVNQMNILDYNLCHCFWCYHKMLWHVNHTRNKYIILLPT